MMTVKEALKKMKDHYHGVKWNEKSKDTTHKIVSILEQAGFVQVDTKLTRHADNTVADCIKIFLSKHNQYVHVGRRQNKQFISFLVK